MKVVWKLSNLIVHFFNFILTLGVHKVNQVILCAEYFTVLLEFKIFNNFVFISDDLT